MPEPALDLRSDGSLLLREQGSGARDEIVEVDLARQIRASLGHVTGQFVRYPTFAVTGLTFASLRTDARLFVRDAHGSWKRLTQRSGGQLRRALRQRFYR